MVKPPFEHFQFSQKWAIFERFEKKKMSKSDWNHIHKLHDTQIHHNTWFLTTFLLKMPQFQQKNCNFTIFQKSFFWQLSWVLEVKLKFQNRFQDTFDHNKCPGSEREDQKCILRKSYFHQIQPNHASLPYFGVKLSCVCLMFSVSSRLGFKL